NSILEFGSGPSSWLLRTLSSDVTSIEQNAVIAGASGATYSPLADNGWYSWRPDGKTYDVILIDGPAHQGRWGILPHLRSMVHQGTIVIVDDTQREDEYSLVMKIKSEFSVSTTLSHFRKGNRMFSVLKLIW